jgi:hypothetical protein
MAEIETRDESNALQIASDAMDRYMDAMDREMFRAGWLAGRDWARLQETRRLADCRHVTPCTSSETCFLKTEG